MGASLILVFVAVLAVAATVFGAGVFWALKKLTKLPTRTHLLVHVLVRLLSALISSVAMVVIFFAAFPLSGRGDVQDHTFTFFVSALVGIPAFIGGTGLGQSATRQ